MPEPQAAVKIVLALDNGALIHCVCNIGAPGPQALGVGCQRKQAMASYHFSAQIIGRAKGRSALAAAAYRAAVRLRDDRP